MSGEPGAQAAREAAIPETLAERHRWYREMGWWRGEGLDDRYTRFVTERPDGLAVVDNRGHRFTHAELWQKAGVLAEDLRSQGLEADDVVLIFMPNWAEWQVALLAILRLGAIPATLPIRTDADTLAYMAELAGARLLIAADRHGSNPTGEVAQAAASSCRHATDVLIIDERGGFTWTVDREGARAPKPNVPGLDHVMFTSSTTGRPKAVMHSADTLAALNIAFSERFSLGPDQPIFMASPLGHSVGAIHGARLSLFNGAPLILQDWWDAHAAVAMIAEHGCAFAAAATPFLKDLIDAPWSGPQPKLAPMRWFLCGGAQVPPALMEQAGEQFPNTFVTVLWGMTEGGLTTCLSDSPRDKVLTTAGVGLPGLDLCILGPDGRKLPAGEEGELAMRGPGVFFGYLGEDDLYRSLVTPDGFFRTGDLARMDADGYVQITGRLKDLLIRGGVNISPVPIEDVLAVHPHVQSVAVVGFPDDRLGERICAVIVPKGEAPTIDDLAAFAVSKGLPKYLCPEVVRFIADMPRTAAGKIRKNELRDMVMESAGNPGSSNEGGKG